MPHDGRVLMADDADDALALRAFELVLAKTRRAVEPELARIWKAKEQRFASLGSDVRGALRTARGLTLRGGKRFRAAVLAIAYDGLASRPRRAVKVRAGAAMELLQTYLLIQDDWMDRDDVRRGGPAAHAELARRYRDAHSGESMAILASDFALNCAVELLAQSAASSGAFTGVMGTFGRLHEGVVVGQMIDVSGSRVSVARMHGLKTSSYTTQMPLLIGASLAGASPSVQKQLDAYAQALGLAFQLRDDLFDVFGNERELGKPLLSDLREGKSNAVLDLARKRLGERQWRALVKAATSKPTSRTSIKKAVRMLEECGVKDEASARLSKLCSRAQQQVTMLALRKRAKLALEGASLALRFEPG